MSMEEEVEKQRAAAIAKTHRLIRDRAQELVAAAGGEVRSRQIEAVMLAVAEEIVNVAEVTAMSVTAAIQEQIIVLIQAFTGAKNDAPFSVPAPKKLDN